MSLENLLSPLQLAGLTLPNRVIMGSMHVGLEGMENGDEALAVFYQNRAKKGGPGLVVTGGVSVAPEGEGGLNFLGFYREKDCEIMRKITTAVHEVDGKIAVQLFHAGRYAEPAITGIPAVAPSPLRSPIHRHTPEELKDSEIHKIIEQFAESAAQAVEFGFDALEIMGSEGYLLNEFLSPVTNKRTDEWGGSLENRMRLSVEVAKAVRQRVDAKVPVIFRMSGMDLIPDSTTEDETLQVAQALEKTGIDALNIGIGWHESKVPTVSMMVPRAGFIDIVGKIKHQVSIPVVGSNRINDPKLANELIENGTCDLISMARPFLADPNIVQKAANAEFDRINTCIACNQACLDHVFEGKPVSCLVNPSAGREHQWRLKITANPKKIAVIGGGPAGMEAARALAEKGDHVTLYEAGSELGGQLNFARRVPGKQEFNETLRYYRHELNRFGVEIRLNTAVTAQNLTKFDEVVFAAGVKPRIPDIKGVHGPNVLPYDEAFQHPERVGRKVAIIGAGGVGCDVAHFLLEQGDHDITIMSRTNRLGRGIGKTTRWALIQHLMQNGVHFINQLSYKEINMEGVLVERIETPDDTKMELVEVDTVIIAAGQESQQMDGLETLGVKVFKIGGAKESGELDAKRAIYEGAKLAYDTNSSSKQNA